MSFSLRGILDTAAKASPYAAGMLHARQVQAETDQQNKLRLLAQKQGLNTQIANDALNRLATVTKLGGTVLPAGSDANAAVADRTQFNHLRSGGAVPNEALGIADESTPDAFGTPSAFTLPNAKGENETVLVDPSRTPEAQQERRLSMTQAATDRRRQRQLDASASALASKEDDLTPSNFKLNGKAVAGFVDKKGNRYDSNRKVVSGDVTPYEPPRRNAGSGNGASGGMSMNRVLSLQQHFNNDQTFKDAQQVATAYQKIKAAATGAHTATSDMSLVYGLMKMQDPGSTVREGEYATAENAKGVPDYIRNLYNKAKEGAILSENQRRQFLDTATSIANAQRGVFAGTKKRYSDMATRQQVDPRDIVFDPYEGILDDVAAPTASAGVAPSAGRGGRGGGASSGNIDLRTPAPPVLSGKKVPTYEEWKSQRGMP